jgi:hypothetical protein
MARRKPDKQVEMERLMPAIDSRLSEFVDAYLFIAITPDGETMVMRKQGSHVQSLALRAMIADYVMGRPDE